MAEPDVRELEARSKFAAQDNVLHEQLLSLNKAVANARAHGLSAEQWDLGTTYLQELSRAVELFRSRWQALTTTVDR
jgi:hypothetical protein